MNNGYLGMVRQWQELFWDRRYSAVEMSQWPGLREARGGDRLRPASAWTDKTTLVDDLRAALAIEGPVVIDARVTKEETVLSDDRAPAPPRATWWASAWAARDQGAAQPRGARGGGEPAHRTQAHPLDPGGEQARRPDADRGLFARRGFNIDTLAVGPTDDESLSRITLTVDGAMHPIDQVTKQLHKLVNVLKIRDLEPDEAVAREMALFKIGGDSGSRGEMMQVVEIFRAKIIDIQRRSVIVEVTGTRRQDRGVRAHGAPVRPDRDGAHGRDRDLARARRDLSSGRGPRVTSLRGGVAPQLDGGRAYARRRAAARARVRRARARSAAVDPRCVRRPGSIRARSCRFAPAGEPGSASSSPTATAPRSPRSARSRGWRRAGRTGSRGSLPRGGALAGEAVADEPDGPPGAGLVAVGGFAFAPEGGAAPHWAASRRRPHRAGAGDRAPRARRAPDGRGARAPDDCPRSCSRASSGASPSCASTPLPLLDPAPAGRFRVASGRRPSTTRRPSRAPSSGSARATFEKIVLAREVAVHAPDAARRRRRCSACCAAGFSSCYVYCAGRGDGAFIGASPELLVRRDGDARVDRRARRLHAPLGRPAVDDHLGEQLLRSTRTARSRRS